MTEKKPERPEGLALLAIIWVLAGLVNIAIGLQAASSDIGSFQYLSNPSLGSSVSFLDWAIPLEAALAILIAVTGLLQIIAFPGLWLGIKYSFKIAMFVPAIILVNWILYLGFYASFPQSLLSAANLTIDYPLYIGGIVSGIFWVSICWIYLTKPHVTAFLGISDTPLEMSMPLETSIPTDTNSSESFLNEKPIQIGSCPKCHCEDTKVIKSSVDWLCFKCRHCGFVFAQKKTPPYAYLQVIRGRGNRNTSPDSQNVNSPTYTTKRRKPINRHTIATLLIVISLIAGIIFVVSFNKPFFPSSNSSSPSPISSSSTSFTLATPTPSAIPTEASTVAPTISPSATPSGETQQDLVNYALSLINTDRQANGLQNVTLSNINSGQLHADDMLTNDYVSHWDLSGYKPYMRYTLANGEGAVEENIAWTQLNAGIFSINVEAALKSDEWGFVYNDSAENWGHKDNILNPLHNEVSIGIAYDNNNVYFVEDFIDDYISWTQLSYNSGVMTMQGIIAQNQGNIQQIAIYYDDPSPLTVEQLGQAPYNDGYNIGTYVGLVVPPNFQAQSGITIIADTWSQSGTSFQISFSLNQALGNHGVGVYTLYLEAGSSYTDLTSYSLFIR